jgi:putative MATE family efflux protein
MHTFDERRITMKSISIQHLRDGQALSLREQLGLVVRLSIPAILAEISSIVMQYIDAAMVGSLGARASAAIGLVSSSSWLLSGLCTAAATGFSVQVAQLVGAGNQARGREVFRQSLLVALAFGILLALLGASVSSSLPSWLGGDADIAGNASRYFLIFSLALPATQLRQLCSSSLQCSGDMKTPSTLNILMCGLDVVFNWLLIFPERQISILGAQMTIPGAGLGVTGAALGTALAEVVTAILMLWTACVRSEPLKLTKGGSWRPQKQIYKTAASIALPVAFEHTVLCGAQVASTHIVAPLGTVAIAANSLGVTAESLCYMPGHGIGSAATTLVGQSIGAGRKDLARRFARLSVVLGVVVMSFTGILMYFLAPAMFALLTPDAEVQSLGVQVLRIEAFAEPLFAASIVAAGALRGAGDTKIPSLLNLVSMWGVRITTASLLAPRLGLRGVWIAMCSELCVRGILFLIRLLRERWLNVNLIAPEPYFQKYCGKGRWMGP